MIFNLQFDVLTGVLHNNTCNHILIFFFQVRFTHLEVPKVTWRKMTERPANRPGPLKLDWEERPVFCYSDRYNYLNREDRKTIFKALMTIRKMQTEYEKTQ